MYYISDYKQQAIKKIIPYLINFPEIVSIIEKNADRYQDIENVLWNIADNFKLDNARGVFLQALAHNEVTKIVYTDKADDAFTYGTTKPLQQAYGTGHYYSQASYISGIKKSVTDEKTIRAVKAKIIQNNTDCKIEDLIEALKLYFNATNIKIFESNPLNISIMLGGKNIEISSSGNEEVIKGFLGNCVALKNLYLDKKDFDIFEYNETSSYGDTRYPILIEGTPDIYKYISHSIELNSEYEEYIKINHRIFNNNEYMAIVGYFDTITPSSTLVSSIDNDTSQNISLNINAEGVIVVNYNGVEYSTNLEAKLNTQYTILISNLENSFKVWVLEGLYIYGKDVNQDISFVINRIKNSLPTINIDNYETINQPIYINCQNINDELQSFSDFVYHAIIFGDINNTELLPLEYYISCYGEKQILFNCFENKNHLQINTKSSLNNNITVQQSVFNYKINHSNGKYLYMDGKSGIDYLLSKNPIECSISDIDISFDICMPVEISTGNIITDFITDRVSESRIYFSNDGKLNIDIPIYIIKQIEDENGEETTVEEYTITTFTTENKVIDISEYANFKISIQNNKINVYKNNTEILSSNIYGEIQNIPNTLRISYDKDITNPYKGFIRNVKLNIIGIDTGSNEHNINIDIPYSYRLEDKDKKYEYMNYGGRLITTPHLFLDSKKLDLYGNKLINER